MLSLADCLLSGLWMAGSSVWLSDISRAKDYNRLYCYLITLLTGVLFIIMHNDVTLFDVDGGVCCSELDTSLWPTCLL